MHTVRASLEWSMAAIAAGIAGVLVMASNSCVTDLEIVGAGPVGGGGAGGGAGGESCAKAKVPDPPESAVAGSDVELVVVLSELSIGDDYDPDVGPTVGYDLDDECTCLGGGEVCNARGAAASVCDGPGGRDNALAGVLALLGELHPAFDSDQWTQKAQAGESSLLVRVRGYNGEANDEQVEVAVFPSPGLAEDPCSVVPPRWDGMDRWPVVDSALRADRWQRQRRGGRRGVHRSLRLRLRQPDLRHRQGVRFRLGSPRGAAPGLALPNPQRRRDRAPLHRRVPHRAARG